MAHSTGFVEIKKQINEMWPQLETMGDKISKQLAEDVCRRVLGKTEVPSHIFEECYKVLTFDHRAVGEAEDGAD